MMRSSDLILKITVVGAECFGSAQTYTLEQLCT